jgi:hypothetical protein
VTAFSLAALVGCGDPCDPATLEATLRAASAGDVVEAGACRFETSLRVPAGVTLRGQGSGRTIVAGTGADSAILLEDGAVLEAIGVEVTLGRGVSASDARVTLRDVVIRGPVDAAGAAALGPAPTPTETATHGLVITGGGRADAPVELSGVDVRGFARFGALFVDSHVAWDGGAASESLGTGIMASGGSLTAADLEVCSIWRGSSPFGYGIVSRGGASVETDRLVLCDNEGAGALHDGAQAVHRALDASGNEDAALWVQRVDGFTLEGATLTGNRLAGVVLVDASLAVIEDSSIEGTREATRIVDDSELRVGDGVQAILPSAAGLRLAGVTLSRNERAGIVLQTADGVVPASVATGVVVEAEGDALGAIAQSESALLDPSVWGAGLERRGTAVANDPAAIDRVSVLGAVAPMFLPPPEP